MARNNQYPIILGMTPPNKQGIGIKSKLGSGYDLYILDEDMTHQYAQIHFCNKEAIDSMIELLQRMKELWEREERQRMSRKKYCDSCEFYMQYAADDWKCDNPDSPKYGYSIDSTVIACNYWEKGWCLNEQDGRPEEKWKPKKVLFEDVGYDQYHDVNIYACICPDCGLHIIEFTDDDVDTKCDSDNPEDMFKSSMVHHGYMGLGNFCERCGRRLDWGDYDKQKSKL